MRYAVIALRDFVCDANASGVELGKEMRVSPWMFRRPVGMLPTPLERAMAPREGSTNTQISSRLEVPSIEFTSRVHITIIAWVSGISRCCDICVQAEKARKRQRETREDANEDRKKRYHPTLERIKSGILKLYTI